MNSKIAAQGFKLLISLNCIFLFIVPLNYSLGPLNDTNREFGWRPDYFYNDEISLIFIAPFLFLWAMYITNKSTKTILAILLWAISAFYAFISFMSVSMLAQDYQPYWGMLLLFLFFPLLSIFFILEKKAAHTKKIYSDRILDENNL
ncbi:hypothetical protein [Aureispira anguillae]|uniref:Uncharacterized protein n=1 Tax=Aureispira anguillae TaxID=2864201 RepID=A0A915YE07_9BACT|nr:hypothetical protein [Aureispira anguillae]BDS11329.1 hypothetical protein AsAng_0020410 [Aureispira anguillae]